MKHSFIFDELPYIIKSPTIKRISRILVALLFLCEKNRSKKLSQPTLSGRVRNIKTTTYNFADNANGGQAWTFLNFDIFEALILLYTQYTVKEEILADLINRQIKFSPNLIENADRQNKEKSPTADLYASKIYFFLIRQIFSS